VPLVSFPFGGGKRTPKEIAGETGLDEKHVPVYAGKLIETGFVERRTPVTRLPASRSGRHFITDPFLRFYFRFLSKRQSQLALGMQDMALAEIKRHLLDFIGTHTWEELCQEWVLRADARKILPISPDQVGSSWTKTAQVDVVGINRMEKTLLLGECKWGLQVVGRAVLQELTAKTVEMIPAEGKWKVYYLGFARSGWTAEAQRYAAGLESQAPQGDNWQAVGMKLLDLKQVDQDLADWTV
jgi:AAA+ ATPase superfamily predicted ATPase